MRINRRSNGNLVALSFDDGPDIGEIELISAMNESGMRATFFWIPEKVSSFSDKYPDDLAELLQLVTCGGHQMGIHGLVCRAPSLFERIFRTDDFDKIIEAQKDFSGLFGTDPILYRPHCFRRFRTPPGMETVIGSHQISTKNDPKKYLRAVAKARPGDIICGHSSRDNNFNSGIASEVGKIVPQIKEILDTLGFKAVTVSEVMENR